MTCDRYPVPARREAHEPPGAHPRRAARRAAGSSPRRPLAALPEADGDAEDQARAHLDFQARHDLDILKVTPASGYFGDDWGLEGFYRPNPEGVRTYTRLPSGAPRTGGSSRRSIRGRAPGAARSRRSGGSWRGPGRTSRSSRRSSVLSQRPARSPARRRSSSTCGRMARRCARGSRRSPRRRGGS